MQPLGQPLHQFHNLPRGQAAGLFNNLIQWHQHTHNLLTTEPKLNRRSFAFRNVEHRSRGAGCCSARRRLALVTRMGAGFVMAENFFRGHPPDEHPWHRNPFFIRVIREIRGSNLFTAASEKGVPGPHSPAEMSGLFSKAGLTKKHASVRKRRISALSEAMRFVRRACRNTPRTPVWPGRPRHVICHY